ncbi:MAG: hypothetical protein Q9188_007563, partial [Gyalolechia gomerana]
QRFDAQGLRIDKSFANLDTSLQHIVTCLADSQTSLSKLVAQESEETRHCITTQIGRLQKVHVDDRRYDDVVHSLFYLDIFSRQEQVDSQFDGIESSYDWIFDEPRTRRSFSSDETFQEKPPLWDDFALWLRSGHGVYWINGKAGSGKSTLMNHICTHDRRLDLLGEWCSTRQLLTPTFFFWNSGSPLQKSIDGLLRSLVYKMLTECRALISCFDNDPLQTWTTTRLQITLLDLLLQSHVPVAVCMFIDGLDEFEGSSDIVLNVIGKLANQTNVKICVSSRPLLVFEQAFSGKPSLKLQDLTFETIQKYAKLKLSEPIQERVSLDNANRGKVEDLLYKIVRRADGVFIWAVIAIRDIREGLLEMADVNELAQMIESLPSELEKLFMLMFDRIKPAYKRDAVQFLQLVLHSEVDHWYDIVDSGFHVDLCTLYFSQSQRGLKDTPFVYEAIATTELISACRTLKTRLQSHTAGLLELTSKDKGVRMYGKMQNLDQILFTKINFVHRTVRDFLLNNAEAKSLLTRMGSTEAQVRLSLAKGILAHIAHFSQGHAKVVDREWPNPVYEPFLASLAQISLSERLLGIAQARLMRSLDFATFARGHHLVADNLDTWYDSCEAFTIDGVATSSIDLVGMAAAVGMTLYVCEKLDLRFESPTGLHSPDYRQALARCLQWKTDDQLRAVAPMGVAPLAETYMLSCCKPTCLDLIHILLRAGANPMVQVECVPPITRNWHPRSVVGCFWDSWLSFLLRLPRKYMEASGVSGGILLESNDFDAQATLKEVFDTTKALLVHGADINYQLEPSYTEDYLRRRTLANEGFFLKLACSASFVLEKCFNTEPEFREFASAMEPLVKTSAREIVKICRYDCSEEGGYYISTASPSAEECGLLWPLIEIWESTGRRDDLDSLQTALRAVWKAHEGEPDWSTSGRDSSADDEDQSYDEDEDDGCEEDEDDGCDDDEDDHSHEEYRDDDSDGYVGTVD